MPFGKWYVHATIGTHSHLNDPVNIHESYYLNGVTGNGVLLK